MKIRGGQKRDNRPRTHDQHYVPRMHLKRFAVPGQPTTIFVYDKRWKGTRTAAIRGQAFERDLYTLNPGSRAENTSIEDKFLAKIDNDAALALDALLAGKLDCRTREVLAVYLATLVLRSPKKIEAQQQHDQRTYTEIYRRMYLYEPKFKAGVRARFKTEAEFEECWKAAAPAHVTIIANKERTMCTGMSIVQRVAKAFLGTSWTLLQSGASDPFILGDTPVFTCAPHAGAKTPVGLLTPGAETTIPVSSQACLLLTAAKSPTFASQPATPDQVREINARSAHASRRRFYGPESKREWLDLANQHGEWDQAVEFFTAPNLDISLNLVENDRFHPLFS